MSNLLEYFRNPTGWAGGLFGGAHNDQGGGLDLGAAGGGGLMHPTSTGNDVLGGLVGGFGGPMQWNGAGFGGGAGGRLSGNDGGYLSGHAGAGAAGGYSSWSGDGRNGVSAAGGVVAPVGVHAGNNDVQASASTNLYRGAGGSAYSTEHGYGANGSYVPLGAADTNVSLNTRVGSATGHADNAYLNRVQAGGSVNAENGNYTGQVNANVGSGVTGVTGNVTTGLGSVNAGVGSANYGTGGSLSGGYDSNTRTASLNGNYSDGLTVNNASVGYTSPGGGYSENASVGGVRYGNSGQFSSTVGPNGLQVDGQGRGGGLQVTDANVSRSVAGVGSMNASLGEFSNDVQVTDAQYLVNDQQTRLQASVDGGGMRFNNFDYNASLGEGPNAVGATAHAGNVGSTNSVTKAFLESNYGDPNDPSLRAGFEDISIGGWSGSDLRAGVTGPGNSSVNASMGKFNQGFTSHNAQATLDRTGLHASADNIKNDTLTLQDINYNANIGNGAVTASGHAGEIATNHLDIQGARAGIDANGVSAHADSANYAAVYLNDIRAEQNIGNGAYQSNIGLGEGGYNQFTGRNMNASLNMSGLSASGDDLQYSYLRGRDISLGQSVGDGAAGYQSRIGSASVGDIGADHLAYNTTLRNTSMNATNLSAAGLRATDVNMDANIGAASYSAHADRINALDLNLGQVDAQTRNFGTEGNVNVSNASLDVLSVQGANAGLSWNGQEQLGARGDARLGGTVENANADYNLMNGTANANLRNANYGAQLDNASVNLFGNQFAVPNMGGNLRANGSGAVDVRNGTANANMSLAGSSVNFGGTTLTAPEWAQASADVNARQGAVNANVGGANGVGVNANLAQGNLDVDLFGRNVDVDGGIRAGATAVSNGAASIRDGASNLANRAWNSLPSIW